MAKAKKHDHQGAIEDYNKFLHTENTPPDVKAMVLFNRALVHAAVGDDLKGVDDLEAVMAMDEASVHVKTMARQKLARMESRSNKSNAERHSS